MVLAEMTEVTTAVMMAAMTVVTTEVTTAVMTVVTMAATTAATISLPQLAPRPPHQTAVPLPRPSFPSAPRLVSQAPLPALAVTLMTMLASASPRLASPSPHS